jgi:chromosome partitioning protein
MWVVTLASQKGGSGKTTLACSLAVAARDKGLRVAVADTDPQASALAWYGRRSAIGGPDVVGIPLLAVRDTVSAARPQYDLLLLDTPGRMAAANDALALADLALVPCRPTIADVDAAPAMHSTASSIARAAAFVITQVPSRGERRARDVGSSLARHGEVCPVRMASRNAYADALALGLGVTEFEPKGKAAAEMRRMWSWVSVRLQEDS